jgi:ADP-L-glycero-D-manno-heptose 6-epimerase
MKKVLITGCLGLIGSALFRRLSDSGHSVIGVDVNPKDGVIDFRDLFRFLSENHEEIGFIFHMGAVTNTLETDDLVFRKYNYGYSESLWYRCARHRIPFIYASSAATYGDGRKGYSDSLLPHELHPLNPYGHSKNEFDRFILSHSHINDAPFWAGLKFFNVYGHDESHKGKMASMVYHAYNQIKETGRVKLFKYGDQKRDFIYVEDVVSCLIWMMEKMPESGIYNVGSGESRTFLSMAEAVFSTLNVPRGTVFIDMPKEMEGKYQPFTQADITKLRKAGYEKPFTTLENGIEQYIKKLEDARQKIHS